MYPSVFLSSKKRIHPFTALRDDLVRPKEVSPSQVLWKMAIECTPVHLYNSSDKVRHDINISCLQKFQCSDYSVVLSRKEKFKIPSSTSTIGIMVVPKAAAADPCGRKRLPLEVGYPICAIEILKSSSSSSQAVLASAVRLPPVAATRAAKDLRVFES